VKYEKKIVFEVKEENYLSFKNLMKNEIDLINFLSNSLKIDINGFDFNSFKQTEKFYDNLFFDLLEKNYCLKIENINNKNIIVIDIPLNINNGIIEMKQKMYSLNKKQKEDLLKGNFNPIIENYFKNFNHNMTKFKIQEVFETKTKKMKLIFETKTKGEFELEIDDFFYVQNKKKISKSVITITFSALNEQALNEIKKIKIKNDTFFIQEKSKFEYGTNFIQKRKFLICNFNGISLNTKKIKIYEALNEYQAVDKYYKESKTVGLCIGESVGKKTNIFFHRLKELENIKERMNEILEDLNK
jgi:hypothetical protein